MIYFATTLGQLRDAVNSYIQIHGEDGWIGMEYEEGHLDSLVSLDWVICDKTTGEIQGTEADDDERRLKENQVNVIRIK